MVPVDLQQAKDESEGVVNGAQLPGVEPSGGSTKALRVYDGRLFDEDPRFVPVEHDRGPETRRPGSGGSGRHKRRRQTQELVGLHDHRVAGSALLVPTCASWSGQMEHLPPDHLRPASLARARSSARG